MTERRKTRKGAWLALAIVAIVAAAGCGEKKPARDALAQSAEAWCPEGFEVGPEDTCFALPEAHGKDTPVLVYLHGMYEGHGSAEEWSLVRSATQRGFAVVVPRGHRGLCAWKAELANHFCWPQEAEDPQAFKNVVREWDRVLWQVDALMEGGPHKRYVLGFSNGGYFASYLATQGLFPAQAFAVVNGGRLATAPTARAVPMVLLSAQGDAQQGPRMKELHDMLAKAAWPHAYCGRGGGHALSSTDLDAALRFFKREAEGSLRTQAGVYPCDPPSVPLVAPPVAAPAPGQATQPGAAPAPAAGLPPGGPKPK